MARSFNQEPTTALRILWHLKRRTGQSSDVLIREFVADGADYRRAIYELQKAGAILVVG